MKPLDDELRAVLSSRADAFPLSDPIVGIERRARRMRRNRVGASVAGAALAVSAIAVAVPALTAGSNESLPPPVATTPTSEPSAAALNPFALDPTNPWPYRGDPQVLENGNLDTFAREWAVTQGYEEPAVSFTPLYGELDEPAQEVSLVYVATTPEGTAWWGVAQSSESGPEFLLDTPLEPGTTALLAALPGDEVGRLLVTAAPDVGDIDYASEGRGEWIAMESIAPGVAVTPLEGDPATDRVRVLDAQGELVFDGPAPDPASYAPSMPPPVEDEDPGAQEPPLAAPSNVVDWPVRGTVDNEQYQQALRAFARVTGAAPEAVEAKVLYAGSYEDRNVMLLQAWLPGQDARAFGYVEAAGNEMTWLGGYTAPGPAVIGLLIPAEAAFLPHDLLLVVPEPAAGQVLYSPDGSSGPQPVADQGTEAAVLVERAPGASGDRVLVLDGNGDVDRPIYRGTVADLLATF